MRDVRTSDFRLPTSDIEEFALAAVRATLKMPQGLADILQPLKSSAVADLTRQGLLQALMWWVKERLPLKFTTRAFSLWPSVYVQRGMKYDAKKWRKWGHRNPMVSGAGGAGSFKESVLGRLPTFKHRTEGRSVKVQAEIPVGRLANLWAGGARRHDFRASLGEISASEGKRMSEIAEAEIRKQAEVLLSDLRPIIKILEARKAG